MVVMSQVDRHRAIRRVDNPEPDTEERQEMAKVIEAEWDNPTTLTEMADMAGFSRQHAVNTIESHFEYLGEPEKEPEELFADDETVEVPKSILDDPKAREAFVRGYEAGYTLAGNKQTA